MTTTDPAPRTPAEALDLDAIEARADAATPGPWELDKFRQWGVWSVVAPASDDHPDHTRSVADRVSSADAEFIAGSREWVPALVAEVRRLRTELADVATERAHLRQYAETVRHHQQSSSEGWREAERLRARVAELEVERDAARAGERAQEATRAAERDDARAVLVGVTFERDRLRARVVGLDTAPATVPLADHPALEWLAIHLWTCVQDGDGSMELHSQLADWLRERQATGLDAVPETTPPAGTEAEHG